MFLSLDGRVSGRVGWAAAGNGLKLKSFRISIVKGY